jgi:hypothetical protein
MENKDIDKNSLVDIDNLNLAELKQLKNDILIKINNLEKNKILKSCNMDWNDTIMTDYYDVIGQSRIL